MTNMKRAKAIRKNWVLPKLKGVFGSTELKSSSIMRSMHYRFEARGMGYRNQRKTPDVGTADVCAGGLAFVIQT